MSAARPKGASNEGAIQISSTTYELIRDDFVCERRGMIEVKGKDEMETYFLVGRRPDRIEFTDAREDARRRDFTINGIFFDPISKTIHDFVDVGLPSNVCDSQEFRQSLDSLLSRIAATKPDVLVAEAGASPLEPYNGDVAVERLKDQVRCTVLCASDPYAVVGVTRGFGFDPDLVSGVATSTSATALQAEACS